MLSPRRIAAATVSIALLFTTAGCGGVDDEPGATPPSSDIPTQSPAPEETSSAPSPGGPPAGWEDKFTPDQLATYDAALTRWSNYNRYVTPIYEAGRDTPEARATLKEYSALFQRDVIELESTYDRGGLRLATDVDQLWTYAKSVAPTYVVIVQCTDYEPLSYTRDGEPQKINKPKHRITPLLIKMTKPGDRWLYGGVTLKDKVSCAA